jgi:glyoxylase I family protein
MAPATQVKKLDHVAIMVADLERSTEFYRDLLGLEKVNFHEEHNIAGASAAHGLADVHLKLYIMAAPDNPEMTLHLSQITTPPSPTGRPAINHVPSSHICFTVPDLNATYESLKSRGVEFVSAPIAWPEDQGGWTLCFLYDPDGNLIELVQPAKES